MTSMYWREADKRAEAAALAIAAVIQDAAEDAERDGGEDALDAFWRTISATCRCPGPSSMKVTPDEAWREGWSFPDMPLDERAKRAAAKKGMATHPYFGKLQVETIRNEGGAIQGYVVSR